LKKRLISISIFDTGAAIPDADTINAGIFSIDSVLNQTTVVQDVNIAEYTGSATTSIVNADFNIANHNDTKFSTDLAMSSFNIGSYNDFTLNASGLAILSTTGLTKYTAR